MKNSDEIIIRKIEYPKIDEGLALIWKVFQQFVAPTYSQEGIDTFYEQYINGTAFKEKFKIQKEVMYGAYIAEKLVGVISLSRNHTISCIFVDGKYHRKGVGKKLYRKLLIEELCIHR